MECPVATTVDRTTSPGTLSTVGCHVSFVLSGFLIVTPLLRERDRDGDISLRGFVSCPFDDFVLTMLITWGTAELSYRFYEQPFSRPKDTLSRRHRRAAEPATAPVELVAEVATGA